jgi:hypothetical protein
MRSPWALRPYPPSPQAQGTITYGKGAMVFDLVFTAALGAALLYTALKTSRCINVLVGLCWRQDARGRWGAHISSCLTCQGGRCPEEEALWQAYKATTKP